MQRLSKILSWSLALLALGFGGMTLWTRLTDCPYRALPEAQERYRPALSYINTVDKALAYLPAYYSTGRPTQLEEVGAVNRFLQDRFSHGVSAYRPCDNWLANMAGHVWINLALPVKPNDILKYRHAICSQQAIVAEAMLKRLGITYASISFRGPGHFVPAAQVNGIWYYFDPDKERGGVTPLATVEQGDTLQKMYPGSLGRELREAAQSGRMKLEDVDTFPGPRGAAFDGITDFLSREGWAVFAALFLLLNIYRARSAPPRPATFRETSPI